MDWHFQPGESGNPNGRPIGARNRRTKEVIERIIHSGATDPLVRLSQLVDSEDTAIAATASNMLAPFMHGKLSATPAPRYIENPFEYPHPNPTTEAEISTNIGALNQAYASGQLDLDSYQTMLAGQHQHVNALKAREDIPANLDIKITGGLPSLPGRNISMPQLPTVNGHETNILAPPQPRILPEQDPDQPPAIPPADEGIQS